MAVDTDSYLLSDDHQYFFRRGGGLALLRQDILHMLAVERGKYAIYAPTYGLALDDLAGRPYAYVCPELERQITDLLSADDRIDAVDSFVFSRARGGKISVSFTVHTLPGVLNFSLDTVSAA